MTRLFLFLIFSLAHSLLSAQALTPEQSETFDGFVENLVEEGSPGLAVGIVRAGKIVYENYAGLADLESERPINQLTTFNIASNGKQFTAWAILNLVDQAKLDLQDDFRTFIPEILPDYPSTISIQHLLNHSSGIRDVYDLWGMQGLVWWKTSGLTNSRALALLANQQSVQFEPGSQFAYSNSNYLILAEIVSRLSQQPFANYVQTLVEKRGFQNSFFLDDHRRDIPTVAKPYFDFGKWYYYRWQSSLHGDGAFFTTLKDQLLWEQQIQSAEPGTLLGKAQSPLAIADEDRYGFGLQFGEFNGLSYRFHEGATGAWKAVFFRFPSLQLSIVVMTNSGAVYPPSLARRIANVLLEEQGITPKGYPLGPETLNSDLELRELPGTYAGDNGFYFRIRQQGHQYLLERPNRDPITIVQEEGNLFHQLDDPDFKQHFQRTENGGQSLTAYYPTHDPYTLRKTMPIPTDFDYESLAGKFYNADLDLHLRVRYAKDRQYELVFDGEKRHNRTADLISPVRMRASGYHLSFEAGDRETYIKLSSERAQDVLFMRQD